MAKRESKSRANRAGSTSADSFDHRLPDPTELTARNFAKSRETRTRILNATIDCLAELGYSATSTPAVARRAGLTRAATIYHFPSVLALMEATINYLTRMRIDMYGEAMAGVPHDDRYYDRATEVAWEQLQGPEFAAFAELSQAARTNAQLSAVVSPALAEYDRARRAWALKVFHPQWTDQPWLDLRRDIFRFLMEGLAEVTVLSFESERRKLEMLEFLKLLWTEPESDVLLERAQQRANRRKMRPAPRLTPS